MSPAELGRSYDVLAEKWQQETHAAYGTAQLKRALQFIAPVGFALDVGCGSHARMIDLMTAHGFELEGIDVSERMIELARAQRPEIVFHHVDICDWPLPRRYDFICAWDSIWHLPLTEQEPVMRKLCDGLAPGGVFIFTTAGLDEPFEKGDTNMGPPAWYSLLGLPETLELLRDCGCVCRHLEYDQYPEKHVYIIAQKPEARSAP